MNTESVSKNYLYTLIRVGSQFLFPLITFPYITRTLGAENLGTVNYTLSIVQYVALLSELGISIYGVREIGKLVHDEEKLRTVFSELLLIRIINTLIVVILFALALWSFPDLFPSDHTLIITSTCYLILQVGMIDWFYQGIQQVRQIAVRTVIVRCLILVGIFVFVKSSSDYNKYYILLLLDTIASFSYGLFIARKYINFRQKLQIYNHFRPLVYLFSVQFAVSVYMFLDKVMLGAISGMTEVGYYTTGLRVVKIIQSSITSIGLVILPVISSQIGEPEKLNPLIKKVNRFIIFMAVPIACGLFVLAPEIITLFAGANFEPSILLLKVLAPIILLVGLSNIYGTQLLVAHGHEKWFFYITLLGALVNYTLNYKLIPIYQSIGASIATICTEIIVALGCIMACRKIIGNVPMPDFKYLVRCGILGVLFFPLKWLILRFTSDIIAILLFMTIGGATLYFIIHTFVFKDELAKSLISRIKKI